MNFYDGMDEDPGSADVAERSIEERFGTRASEVVAACFDTFEQSKPAWPERKRRSSSTSIEPLRPCCGCRWPNKLHKRSAIVLV